MGIFDSLRKKKVVKADEDLQTSQAAAVSSARKTKDDDEKKEAAAPKAKAEPKKKAAAKSAKPKKTDEAVAAEPELKKASTVGSLEAYRWLKRPHISEKAAVLTELDAYVFDVPMQAEKIAIRRAVEALYKVNVLKVRIIRHAGKPVNRGRHHAKRADWKKAIVTLKKGQKLDLYEGV